MLPLEYKVRSEPHGYECRDKDNPEAQARNRTDNKPDSWREFIARGSRLFQVAWYGVGVHGVNSPLELVDGELILFLPYIFTVQTVCHKFVQLGYSLSTSLEIELLIAPYNALHGYLIHDVLLVYVVTGCLYCHVDRSFSCWVCQALFLGLIGQYYQ